MGAVDKLRPAAINSVPHRSFISKLRYARIILKKQPKLDVFEILEVYVSGGIRGY
jgi:hypothetical protein